MRRKKQLLSNKDNIEILENGTSGVLASFCVIAQDKMHDKAVIAAEHMRSAYVQTKDAGKSAKWGEVNNLLALSILYKVKCKGKRKLS